MASELQGRKVALLIVPEGYNAVVIPGGAVGADKLRGDDEAVSFIRSFFEQGKPVGPSVTHPGRSSKRAS